MARAFGFLASFVAVVAGCVALVRWLDTLGVQTAFIVLVVFVVTFTLIGVRVALARVGLLPWEGATQTWAESHPVAARRGLGAELAVAFIAFAFYVAFDAEGMALISATALFAGIAGPLVFDLYGKDKASRKACPDCCEEVKAGARVCRYCGYRWLGSEVERD